jgi:UDP-N-acetylglucosamine--N-acetylmuramyl-(pentapeptide) pyrophosphoryl-undecaprenol N-acetylglucosamine transferase
LILTGNPVRQQLLENTMTPQEARRSFGMAPDKKTILIVGGSLGARTINKSILNHLEEIRKNSDVQLLWQTGKYYKERIEDRLMLAGQPENLVVTDFISDMGAAYKAADLVVSRAGAGSISEFCLLGKAVILVPSPNVAEDHQTKNAMALVNKQAALLVKDAEAEQQLMPLALQTLGDAALLKSLSEHILQMALPDSADIIAKEVIKIANHGD